MLGEKFLSTEGCWHTVVLNIVGSTAFWEGMEAALVYETIYTVWKSYVRTLLFTEQRLASTPRAALHFEAIVAIKE